MPVSTSSIFSPERRPYSAFQSSFLSWARSEHGIRIIKQAHAALRIFRPLSFLHSPIRNRLDKPGVRGKPAVSSCFHGLPYRWLHPSSARSSWSSWWGERSAKLASKSENGEIDGGP